MLTNRHQSNNKEHYKFQFYGQLLGNIYHHMMGPVNHNFEFCNEQTLCHYQLGKNVNNLSRSPIDSILR